MDVWTCQSIFKYFYRQQRSQNHGKKSSKKLIDAFQDSKHPELDTFLYALGIRHVGRHIARVLARQFQTLDTLRQAEQDELESTPEVGSEIAESVYHFFQEKENQKIINRLLEAGVKVKKAQGQ